MNESDEAPRTVFVPHPGGRSSAAGAPREAVQAAPGERRFGVNPMVDAAGEILELAVYLRGQASALDIDRVRDNVEILLRDFHNRANASDTDRGTIRDADYALCATVDGVILSSPWGFDSGWQRNPLVSIRHGEVIGGDRFFELLAHAERDPARSRDLLELLYICLSLGFRGRYGRDAQGVAALEEMRDRVYRGIDTQRRGLAETLSTRWRGKETTRTRRRDYLPVWLLAGLAALLIALMLVGAAFADRGTVAEVGREARALPPDGAIRLVNPPPVDPPIPVIQPDPPDIVAIMSCRLRPLIERGVISAPEVRGSSLALDVRSSSPQLGAMFASGDDRVSSAYKDVLREVSEAIAADTQGPITVRGHADLVPLTPNARHANNYELSRDRAINAANAVLAALLRSSVPGAAGREVFYDPVGDTEPVIQATTPEANVRNRRIEIVLPNQQIAGREDCQ